MLAVMVDHLHDQLSNSWEVENAVRAPGNVLCL